MDRSWPGQSMGLFNSKEQRGERCQKPFRGAWRVSALPTIPVVPNLDSGERENVRHGARPAHSRRSRPGFINQRGTGERSSLMAKIRKRERLLFSCEEETVAGRMAPGLER